MARKQTSDRKILKDLGVELDDGFDIELRSHPYGGDPDARWTIRVSLGKDHVTLRQPARGHMQLDTGKRGSMARRSIKTSDPKLAIERAKDVILHRRTAPESAAAAQDQPERDLLVGDIARLLPSTTLWGCKTWEKYQRAAEIARHIWGAARPLDTIGSDDIEAAMRLRMEGLPILGLKGVGGKTARGTFLDFKTCVNAVARTPGPDKRPIAPNSPWETLKIPLTVRRRRNGGIVNESTEPRNLFAYPMRLVEELLIDGEGGLRAAADEADPSGQLRLMLTIAVFTGRRIASILTLRLEDIARTEPQIRRILEMASKIDPSHSHRFPHGVLNFRPETDKSSLMFPIPIGRVVHSELLRYLSRHRSDSEWLFPRPSDPSKPASYQTFFKSTWTDPKTGRIKEGRFQRALRLVEERVEKRGEAPERYVPRRSGNGVHRLRQTFTAQTDKLGYAASGRYKVEGSIEAHVDYIGGWNWSSATSTRIGTYLGLDPEVLQGIADWRPASEVLELRERQASEETGDLLTRLLGQTE